MSGQEGIDRLLAAESEATEIVSKARKEKTARIKQARDQAEDEIKKLRGDMDRDFKNAEFSGSGGGDKSAKLQADTEGQLAEIRRLAEANRVNVVRQILSWITTVDTTPPPKAGWQGNSLGVCPRGEGAPAFRPPERRLAAARGVWQAAVRVLPGCLFSMGGSGEVG
eukprot:CAMPEP_0174926398 /NCGR_PEP_ID=MMETSP1355-20121228/11227_1 /TAXON_ID=464990 /ORGANISM="Hemiselmis tepida, Strain CCMP443" /LENGTH=166 /DNA_ID=CAMNT_0016172427 /DNA_START=14 /DNA_END=511 /DNA_ORIENTATION=+